MAAPFDFEPVPSGTAVKGGLSFSNGNCIEVSFDGVYYRIRDSKLGPDSPEWVLTPDQFERLARGVSRSIGSAWDIFDVRLDEGVLVTIKRAEQYHYCWTLHRDTGQPPVEFAFSLDETVAFYWGHVWGQFRKGEPVRRLVAINKRFSRCSI